MPFNRNIHYPTYKDSVVFIRGRIYRHDHAKSAPISCPVVITPEGLRYAAVETSIGGHQTQPYVHDILLEVRCGKKVHNFQLFIKRHCRLPQNQSTSIHGDVLFMRVGVDSSAANGVVNTRTEDRILINKIFKRILPKLVHWQASSIRRVSGKLIIVV